MEDRQCLGRVEVVVENLLELTPIGIAFGLEEEGVAERFELRTGLLDRLVGEVDRLRPVACHEEQHQRLATPAVERVADRDDVPFGLRHLLAGEAQHPVVRPDVREVVSERAGLRQLVLVMREHQIEPAAVDLEHGPEKLLRHHRALDVPARAAAAPGRLPPGVLARLVGLPEREVARILLARIRDVLLVLAFDVVDALA